MNLIIFTGCGGAEEEAPTEIPAEADATEAEEIAMVEETVEPTATPLPTQTPTPTPTPIPPEIVVVDDAPVYIEDVLLIDTVKMPEDGWIAIWPNSGSQLEANDVIAFAEIEKGEIGEVKLVVDGTSIKANQLQVALHSGRIGPEVFEDHVEDVILIQTIQVETAASRPFIETETDVVSEAGFLQVDLAQLDGPGWLAAYSIDGGELLGFAAVPADGGSDISVPIQWRRATSQIQLHLLHDLGNEGEFEAEIDVPVIFQGESIQQDLAIGLPAEMVVFDQPMEGSIFIHRVTTPRDGYAVAFSDDNEDGFPDRILGAVQIEKGSNEFLEIDIEQGSATNQVVMSLYYDSNGSGQYDFPEDEPIMLGTEDLSQLLLPVRSDIEGLLMVNASPSVAGVDVMLVATPLDGWLIVESAPNADGERTVLGQQKIPAGLFHNLQVSIDGAAVGDAIRIMVYVNNPDPDLFEPERNDFPLLADQRQLFVELVVTE
ncbi:MAG: hypothetical protein AAF902_18030 [Chloroflexota bacterium]